MLVLTVRRTLPRAVRGSRRCGRRGRRVASWRVCPSLYSSSAPRGTGLGAASGFGEGRVEDRVFDDDGIHRNLPKFPLAYGERTKQLRRNRFKVKKRRGGIKGENRVDAVSLETVCRGEAARQPRQTAGSSCVRQCSVPSPHTRSTAWIPTTVRVGKHSPRIPSASRSRGSLNVGTSTTSLPM